MKIGANYPDSPAGREATELLHKIIEKMQAGGISQSGLARRSGWHQPYISMLVSNKGTIRWRPRCTWRTASG